MKSVICCILIFLAICKASNGPKSLRGRNSLEFDNTLLRLLEAFESNPHLQAEFQQTASISLLQEPELPPVNFDCDVTDYSDPYPSSVHQVRPSDVRVIAALGDSITAGNGLGATSLPEVALENRGESWCIGGDKSLEEGVITVPNIIKKFNPDLKGYSTCYCREQDEYKAWFNVAVPGAKNDDMLTQSEYLVARMKADQTVDYENDWKVLTMFVGGNDLCGSCRSPGRDSPEVYYNNFESALVYLSMNMPRTIVNLVSMFDVTLLQNFSKNAICDMMQWGFCGCARNLTTLKDMRPRQLGYHEKLRMLSEDTRFQLNNFAVVHQPHMRDLLPPIDPNTGKYYMDVVGYDCFHPTRPSHQGMAVWLWNTMLTPVGKKPTSYDSNEFNTPIFCPTQKNPYIFTSANSVNAEWPEINTSGVAKNFQNWNQILLILLASISAYFIKQ